MAHYRWRSIILLEGANGASGVANAIVMIVIPWLVLERTGSAAYAGIVPRTLQSGGPDSPAVQGHASPRCNRILKDWTVQSAQKIHLYGPPELKDRITRWNANGQHGIFAAATPPPEPWLRPASDA